MSPLPWALMSVGQVGTLEPPPVVATEVPVIPATVEKPQPVYVPAGGPTFPDVHGAERFI